MSRSDRDKQRSRVYAWERSVLLKLGNRALEVAEFDTLGECEQWALPIWRRERGRVGLARVAAPAIERPSWGQRRALAHDDHRITLPRWARNRWVILHELAHRLTPHDEAHGPRFVGVLIGLVCRWLDYDANQLMRMADEQAVKYHVRSVGVVPVRGPAWHVEKILASARRSLTPMEIACELSIGFNVPIACKQVQGAAVHLVKTGRAHWWKRGLRRGAHPSTRSR